MGNQDQAQSEDRMNALLAAGSHAVLVLHTVAERLKDHDPELAQIAATAEEDLAHALRNAPAYARSPPQRRGGTAPTPRSEAEGIWSSGGAERASGVDLLPLLRGGQHAQVAEPIGRIDGLPIVHQRAVGDPCDSDARNW